VEGEKNDLKKEVDAFKNKVVELEKENDKLKRESKSGAPAADYDIYDIDRF